MRIPAQLQSLCEFMRKAKPIPRQVSMLVSRPRSIIRQLRNSATLSNINNELCFGACFALCIVKALRLVRLDLCSGTVITRRPLSSAFSVSLSKICWCRQLQIFAWESVNSLPATNIQLDWGWPRFRVASEGLPLLISFIRSGLLRFSFWYVHFLECSKLRENARGQWR